MIRPIKLLLRRLLGDRRGSALVLVAFATFAVAGFAALVVDVGYMYRTQRMLQETADAAALAGAARINCCQTSDAVSTAMTYSAAAGKMNADPNMSVTTNAVLRCATSTGVSCNGVDSANAIVVGQTATVPLFFGKVLGFDTAQISAQSVAGSLGGTVKPVDAMVIIDTTASMNTVDPNCSIQNATRLDCALAGFRTLLTGFTPPAHQVGLMLFPGLTASSQAANEYDCSSSTPTSSAIQKYNLNPNYLIVGLSTDYNDGHHHLNTSSNLVKAARGGASGCTAGVSAIGGVSTFYADAITAAQNYLTANGRSSVQKMIILLSDGDANAATAPNPHQECHQAITVAQNATNAGTTVVTIAYGAATSGSCSTDTSPSISACSTLQQMATQSPKWFYSDTLGGTNGCTSSANSASDLSAIFQSIIVSLTRSRLLPPSTT